MRNFFEELNRRNVIKATISYVVVSWVTMQVSDILFQAFEISSSTLRYVLFTLVGGLPFWIFFAYRFEWTQTGFKKTDDVTPEASVSNQTGKRLNHIIIGSLIIAVFLLLADRFFNITRSTTETAIPAKSIAVLPFVNISDDPAQEYFSDGLTEELLNLLAKMPDLKVIARTSSFAFKGKNEDLRVIGEKLSVAHILEGSVRKNGDRLRITAQLIRVDDGTHLWSETYDRTLDDIFKVQDDIAGQVVHQLKVKLLGGKVPLSVTMKPEAYNLYMEAKYIGGRRNMANLEMAEAKLKEALNIDPNAAPVWTYLAAIYYTQISKGYKLMGQSIILAKEAINKALTLDPNYGEAHALLGQIYMSNEFDVVKAEEEMKLAMALDPGSTEIMTSYSSYISKLGQLDKAIIISEKSIESDPLRAVNHVVLGLCYYRKLDWVKAEASIRKVLELTPERSSAYYQLTLIQLLSGREQEALKTIELENDDIWKSAGLPMVYFKVGLQNEANVALDEFIEKYSGTMAYQIAEIHVYMDQINKSFEWLERAYQQRDIGLSEMLADPFMKKLHNDPRWVEMLERVGLAKYWPEYKAKYLD